jgi:drug/metabolite transporter (DMT)-like permease
MSESKTPIETPVKAVTADDTRPPDKRPRKANVARSEFQLSLVTILGTVLTLVSREPTTTTALVSVILTAGAYAIFQTDIVSKKPGWKTIPFWTSLLTVLASIALAISEANIPGLPEGVTRLAAVLAAALTSAGYTAYRYKVKRGGGAGK